MDGTGPWVGVSDLLGWVTMFLGTVVHWCWQKCPVLERILAELLELDRLSMCSPTYPMRLQTSDSASWPLYPKMLMPAHPGHDGPQWGACQQGREKFLQLGLLLNSGLAWPMGWALRELAWMQRRHGCGLHTAVLTGTCQGGTEQPCCVRALAELVSSFFLTFYF